MRRLTANKTKLYRLVAEFESLPPMRRTTFTKAFRQPDYFLRWADSDNNLCTAYFTTVMGKPRLVIGKQEFCGKITSRVVHGLNADDLARRGMVEELGANNDKHGTNHAERTDA